ncbi:glycosyltransferase family 2 protein [Oceanobacillus saliphilus]|uniref:glycosyltransferase family 2 protein n=1 Tax=Oceanobacillus saliphilus TaxID=2925834 RepID=UPI00201D33B5|nr:glycosyltransferase [Oceanobacillus saliphilus]
MNPIISIVVPVYNVESYLKDCIDSILAQSFNNYELILVNDGSTDRSGEICDEYAANDNRIKVIHSDNAGVSSARNKGIYAANGKYIGFVDPDDTINQNMFELLLNALLEYNSDIVVCPFTIINQIKNTVTISPVWEESNCVITKETIETAIIPKLLSSQDYSLMACFNKLYKKEILDNTNIKFDERRNKGEDARLNFLLLTQINSIVFIDDPLYNYNIRQRESLSRVFDKDLYNYLLDNRKFGVSLCYKYNVSEAIDKITNDYLISTLSHMQNVVLSDLTYIEKYNTLAIIMGDSDFNKYILNFKCPSKYYTILKKICIFKNINLFIWLVKFKRRFHNFIKIIMIAT